MENTVLYRYFDSDNRLLYVGITKNQSRRFSQHNHKAQWIDLIHTATFQHFKTREEAFFAEAQAIKNEKPLYNIAGNEKAIVGNYSFVSNDHFLRMFCNSADQQDELHEEFCCEIQRGIAWRDADKELRLGSILTGTEYIALSMKLAMDEWDYPNVTQCPECVEIFASGQFKAECISGLTEIEMAKNPGVDLLDTWKKIELGDGWNN